MCYQNLKEKIIEFPLCSGDMFDSPLNNEVGFCISYQYDMDLYGFGPYGFCTQKANKLLGEVFSSAVYWHVSRAEMVDVAFPLGAGLYFFNNQKYVDELKVVLTDYEKAYKLWTLRSRYRKNEDVGAEPVKPSIFTVSDGSKFSSAFLSELLQEKCRFFIVFSLTPYDGQTLALFDRDFSVRIRAAAHREGITYQVLDSADDLKPW
jgi:hypothetical protein